MMMTMMAEEEHTLSMMFDIITLDTMLDALCVPLRLSFAPHGEQHAQSIAILRGAALARR
jgi:hypothetical protein